MPFAACTRKALFHPAAGRGAGGLSTGPPDVPPGGQGVLADGDALVRRAEELYIILDTIRELFPECRRVTSYASPASIRIRTAEELRTLRQKGLTMVYMGLESGCDAVLKRMRKGHLSGEIVEMGRKVRENGIAPVRHGNHGPGWTGGAGAPRH